MAIKPNLQIKCILYISAPIANISVKGNYWLQQGDLLNLDILCNGSGPFSYCKTIHDWPYNITGNETCLSPDSLAKCEFAIQWYFRDPGKYTLAIILANDIGKNVSQVTVTVYEGKEMLSFV